MPCNTITSASIDLRNANIVALKSAMTSLGWTLASDTTVVKWTSGSNTAVFDRVNGLVIRTGNNSKNESDIKQAYTGAVINMTAKKFGWIVQKTAENQFAITKR